MLFRLIEFFSDLPQSKVDELRRMAKDDVAIQEKEGKPQVKKLITIQKHWLSQIGMVFFGLALRRWIQAWISSPVNSNEEEDPEELTDKDLQLLHIFKSMNANKKSGQAFEKL